MCIVLIIFFFFFFNDTATTEIYTLSLHDALPILVNETLAANLWAGEDPLGRDILLEGRAVRVVGVAIDRKSTRLNSSHPSISYAVFCLKKKKNNKKLRNIHVINTI